MTREWLDVWKFAIADKKALFDAERDEKELSYRVACHAYGVIRRELGSYIPTSDGRHIHLEKNREDGCVNVCLGRGGRIRYWFGGWYIWLGNLLGGKDGSLCVCPGSPHKESVWVMASEGYLDPDDICEAFIRVFSR